MESLPLHVDGAYTQEGLYPGDGGLWLEYFFTLTVWLDYILSGEAYNQDFRVSLLLLLLLFVDFFDNHPMFSCNVI